MSKDGLATAPGNRFRRARLKRVIGMIESINSPQSRPLRVLDIGGTAKYWQSMRDLWSHLQLEFTLVNIGVEPADAPPFSIRAGDARALDFADNSFDLVHSNSVIEHVGHWPEMMAMAAEVRRVAPRYFVQTPNFWFPLEPHYRTLFFQWYPESVRARMLVARKRGFRGPEPTFDAAMRNVQTVNLLTATQLAALFPDARIERERVATLTKSLMAVKD